MEFLPQGRYGQAKSRGIRNHRRARRAWGRAAIMASAAVLASAAIPAGIGLAASGGGKPMSLKATVAAKLEGGDPLTLSALLIPLGSSRLTSVTALARAAARRQAHCPPRRVPRCPRARAPIPPEPFPRETALPHLPSGKHSTWTLLS